MWYDDYSSDFNEEFIKNYNENSDDGYFLEVNIKYPKILWGFHKELPFLPERRKLEKVEKLVIRALKQALNNGLKLKIGTQSNYVSTISMVKVVY